MKTSTALISVGILTLTVSVGSWAFSRPSLEAGDPTAFEQALVAPKATPATSTPGPAPAAAGPTDPAPGPRFTIGETPADDDRTPVGLRIPALGQNAPVVPVGVEANGDMKVPDNVRDVAWYRYGASPGEPGSAVLAAHVDLEGQGPGVFFGLRELEPGSLIFVDFDDGSVGAYVARARATYEKESLPIDAIFSRQGPATLTLITCGGDFNRSIRRYDSNVVVYAVPVDTVPLPFT